ncbi:hypothetical protein F0562_015794 [Nyssa sinensis]|uniref:Uncharacterized protein n=1 Tax=Nyssa sinensis TaxID=561372 RepID=A0A5J4ZKH3_9ASTE|nr:hypothetical protein F0562_015794 [Nyssa sinensis]
MLLMEPFLSAAKMYSLVQQEEKQQEIHYLSTHVPDVTALNTVAKPNNFYPNRIVVGSNRPSPGGENRPSSSNRKPKYHCDHYGRDGHSNEQCFKIIGYLPKRSNSSNSLSKPGNKVAPFVITQEQYDKLLAMLSSGNINPSSHLAGIFPFRDVPRSSAPSSTVIPLPVHDNGNFDFSPHPSPPVPNGHVDILNNSALANLDVVDDDPPPITEPASAHAPVPLLSLVLPPRRRRQLPYLADYLCSSATHGASSLPSDSLLKANYFPNLLPSVLLFLVYTILYMEYIKYTIFFVSPYEGGHQNL